MSKQDLPHKGSSSKTGTVSGLPGTSGGSEAAQCLSVAESAPPWRPEPVLAMMLDLAHDLQRANAQLTAERDRARDLAAALEAELAATRTTRHPSWCLHGDTYRHCPTTPTHPNAE